MIHCQTCRYELAAGEAVPATCPRCGETFSDTHETGVWIDVARLDNLAEVGYFADVLEAEEIATRVQQRDHFSALEGCWQMRFLLQVPEHSAARAVERLKREQAQADENTADAHWQPESQDLTETFGRSRSAAGSDGVVGLSGLWNPIVWATIAGGLAYVLGSGGIPHRPQPDPQRSPLWQALSESPRPLVSEAGQGEPQRRLRYDPPSHTVVLEEDTNGDGHFDRQRQFHQPQAR